MSLGYERSEFIANKWNKVGKNIFQSEENPRKYRVELYFGRDERGKVKKSREVMEGTLKDIRTYLKMQEVGLLKGMEQKPMKVNLGEFCFEKFVVKHPQ